MELGKRPDSSSAEKVKAYNQILNRIKHLGFWLDIPPAVLLTWDLSPREREREPERGRGREGGRGGEREGEKERRSSFVLKLVATVVCL